MNITGKYLEFIAELFVKIFQIVFGLLVVGMLIQDRFNLRLFIFGLLGSLAALTAALGFYYNGCNRKEG